MELVSFAHAPIYAKISPHVDLVKLQDASDGWCVKAQASDTSPGNQIMFKKGDIVIEIDPLAACVNGVKPQENSVMELVCAGCCRHDLESRSTLKRCGGCSVAYFCSYACQKRVWHMYHKYECRYWKEQPRKNVNRQHIMSATSVRLLTMLLTRLKEEKVLENPVDVIDSLTYADAPAERLPLCQMNFDSPTSKEKGCWLLRCLQFMWPRAITSKDFDCDNTDETAVSQLVRSIVFKNALQNSANDVLYNLVRFLHVKLVRNCFSVLDSGLQVVGAGIYPLATFFNHACLPNCMVVFDKTRMTIVSQRNIYQNEELTIGYTRSTDTFTSMYFLESSLTQWHCFFVPGVSDRRTILLRQYGFSCNCLLCNSSSIFALAYNLGCEEQLCPMCMSEVLNGNFYAEAVGSYTWFATASRQFHHSKITNANKNTVTQHEKPFSSEERKFLSSPCTMKRSEASHALTRCRRCNYETAFDLDVLDCSLSDTSYEHLNMSFSTFIESFCHTSDLQSNVLSFLDQWPEENCFRHCPSTARSQVVLLLATIARIERCRSFINRLSDVCAASADSTCSFRTLRNRLSVLSILLGQYACGIDDLAVNLEQLRDDASTNSEKTRRGTRCVLENALRNVGCYSRYFPSIQNAVNRLADLAT